MMWVRRGNVVILPALLAGILLWHGEARLARGAVEMESREDRLILENFLKHTESCVRRFTPEAMAQIEQPEDLCWTWSRYVEMPLVAYQLSGDTKHLDGFVKAMDVLLTRLRRAPDGYLGFRGLPLPLFRSKENPTAEIEVDIAEFEIADRICEFVNLVRADERLAQAYGGKATEYLELAEEHLAGPKWEARKLYVDLGDQGAVFRMPPECGNNRDHLTNPHNKQSKMCRAYLALYRTTDQATSTFARPSSSARGSNAHSGSRAITICGTIGSRRATGTTSRITLPSTSTGSGPNTGAAITHSRWPWPRPSTTTECCLTERTCSGLSTPRCKSAGTDQSTRLNSKTTAGRAAREAQYATVIAPSLARFEPKVREFCYGPRATQERVKSREHGWQGGVSAIDYLRGKYLEILGAEPARTRYRDKFCQTPENAALLKTLQFDVQ